MKTANIIACIALQLLTVSGFSQVWLPSNVTTNSPQIWRIGKVGLGTGYVPDASSAWYNPNPAPQFESWTTDYVPTGVGSHVLMSSFSASGGSSWVRSNKWLFRVGSASGWTDMAVHDGISVDNSYQSPRTDSKTWWERKPSADLQTWGNDNNIYVRLAQGKLAMGKDMWYNPDDAGAWYNSVTGNYFAAPQFELWSTNYPGNNPGDAAIITSYASRTGSSGSTNWLRHNNYIRRKSNASNGGNGWDEVALHDGISIDDQFLYPGITTRTYWERDPFNDIQSWGTAQSTYMSLVNGKLNIGGLLPTNNTHYSTALLSVKGKIVSKEVIVTNTNWADFVFDEEYKLMPLIELEKYYTQHHHLPEVPSTKEIEVIGVDLGKTNVLLLQKIEELTLYVVKQDKEIKVLFQELCELKKSDKNNRD